MYLFEGLSVRFRCALIVVLGLSWGLPGCGSLAVAGEVEVLAETARIVAQDISASDTFGRAISLDGTRIAIGANGDTSSAGSAYIFELDPDGSWNQVAKLTAPDGAPFDNFGEALSLDGDRVVIGAPDDDDRGEASGSVYLFERDQFGSWRAVDKLTPLDGASGQEFGESTAFEAGRVAVGAPRADVPANNSGFASVFDQVVVSPQLTVEGVCPGEVTLMASGVTPRDGIDLFGADALGVSAPEVGPCAGTPLELDHAGPLRRELSDFDGVGTIVRTVDESFCGFYLQLLDQKTCLTSEVAQIPTE